MYINIKTEEKNTLPEHCVHTLSRAHTLAHILARALAANKVLIITFFCRRRQKDKNSLISSFIVYFIRHKSREPNAAEATADTTCNNNNTCVGIS